MTAAYGPQTPQIEALIERAKTLADDEAEALGAAWDVTRVFDWDTAFEAMLYAAPDAGRIGAYNAAVDAIWGSMWVATWNGAAEVATFAAWEVAPDVALSAASALVIRDLISEDGFTQAHYDTLTGPWRRVIGPIHPDDAEVQP